MHHIQDATVLIFIAVVLTTIERIGLAVTVGGLAVWLLLR